MSAFVRLSFTRKSSDPPAPRTVVPISAHQDTVGPMARSVADAAAVLSVIAGPDPRDNYTTAQPAAVPDYATALKKDALRGKRIGVPRKIFLNQTVTGLSDAELVAFAGALETLARLGATVVDNADLPSAEEIVASGAETTVLDVDFKVRGSHYAIGLTLIGVVGGVECVLRRLGREPERRALARGSHRVQRRAPGA